MRNLASVVTVKMKQKMFEKDKICCVSFEELGYEAIVPNTVNVGDKLAFIQEGSILPEIEAWEFLRKRCYSEKLKGFVIRPMVMGAKETETGEKGDRVRSWGLAVGLDELPITDEKVISKLKPGDDLTDLLEIRKYEPEEDASPKGNSKKAYPKWVKFCLGCAPLRWIGRIWQKNHQNSAGGFPTSIISKSDETTVQNMPSVIEKFKDELVYTSIKIEGQSCVSSDTIVRTEYGDKTIKEIVENNYFGKVLSFNDNTGELEYKNIMRHIVLDNDKDTEWFELTLDDGTVLKITGNDKVYLPDLGCYRRVDELNGNENLLIND